MQQQIELSFSCSNLPNLDVMSKSDPQVILFDTISKKRILGKTEKINNSLEPKFQTTIIVDFSFTREQKLFVQVVDIDNDTGTISDQDLLGEIDFILGEIVANRKITKSLKSRTGDAKITIAGEMVRGQNEELTLKFSAKNVDKKDMFSSDPYFEIWRKSTNKLIHTSETIQKDLNPSWKPFKLSFADLCNGNTDTQVLINVWDEDQHSADDLIGQFETSVAELLEPNASFKLINPKKKAKKKSYDNSGLFQVDKVERKQLYSFAEYVTSGYRLGLIFAIDFTGSNGPPGIATSLHHLGQGSNQYQRAIMAIGQVLQPYDSDGMIASYLFGAKVQNQTSHCWPLSLNQQVHELPGVAGVLSAYATAVQTVTLSGPTNFAPFIRQSIEIAKQNPQNFQLCVILTDGEISDFNKTVEAIVDASKLTMAIVIVGIGRGCDFQQMDRLDGDGGKLRTVSGRAVARDVVNFIPFSQFENGLIEDFAAEVLREVPRTFCESMRALGLKPIGK